jgi:Tol biopolymer transport system component
MDARGGDLRFVRRLETCWQGSHLSWSSDGRILFSDSRAPESDEQPGEAPSLWAVQPDGNGAVRLHEPTQLGLEFGAVSRDGRLITMTRSLPTPEYRVDVYLLDTATGALTRVTADGVSLGATFLR